MEVKAEDWFAHGDFLAHYGVVGMKWGVRKMNKTGVSQDYINRIKKKYGKAIKFNKKSKKYEIDKNTDDYKKAKGSTIKKAAIGTAAAIGAGIGLKKIIDGKKVSNKKFSYKQLEKMGIKTFKPIYFN